MAQQEVRPPGELAFACFLLIISGWSVWAAYNVSGFGKLSDPGTVPLIAAGLMLVSAGLHVFNCVRRRAMTVSGPFRAQVLPGAVVVFTVLALAYAVAMNSLGFILASLLFLAISFMVLGKVNPLRSLALSALLVVIIYIAFRLVFLVLLPEGIIPEREIMAAIGDMLWGR